MSEGDDLFEQQCTGEADPHYVESLIPLAPVGGKLERIVVDLEKRVGDKVGEKIQREDEETSMDDLLRRCQNSL